MKKATAVILALLTLSLCLGGCAPQQVRWEDSPESYVKTMDYREGFNILQLTDIHWNSSTQTGNGSYGSEAYLKKLIDEAASHAGGIDLIEITGDTFMLSNRQTVKSFIAFMESTGIPYAMVWGNHDREGTYNPNWIMRQFEEAPHCLYTEVDNDNVHERCNYIINLVDGDKTVWQLVQLDSGASYRQGAGDMFLTYDYIREDQFSWLRAQRETAGYDVPALCFYHIAQAECDSVFDEIRAGSQSYKSRFFKLESFAASDYAVDTRELFAQLNVKGVFMGHCHNNDWTFTTPEGVTYGFGVKTGKELYYATVEAGYEGAGVEVEEEFDLIGASLITLTDTDSFAIEHLYLNERDGGDFIKWVSYDE